MTQWTDTNNDWFTSSTEDWWTDEGFVEYVFSISRYFFLAESVNYYFTTVPAAFNFITEPAQFYFEAGA